MKDQIRSEFEQEFPLPKGVTFDGDHYVADPNVFGSFQNATIWSHMFRGWKASAQPARQVDGDSHGPARQVGEYGDAYQGAREDLAIWKRRALEAEETVRELEARIDTLILDCQGETRMGEPVIPVARQVGGDERGQFIAWAVESFPDTYTREAAEHYWDKHHVSALAWQARAALAQAAACVMPERKSESAPPPFERGYNAALDEVARLNRRAIPAAELEQIAVKIDSLEDASGFACGIGDELRSLLGKEGE